MKRIFVACLLALVASAVLVALIEYDPGYVLINYGYYTLESTLAVAVISLLVFMLVVYFLIRLVFRIINQSAAFRNWFSGFSGRRGDKLAARGLLDYSEGNWSKAAKSLSSSAQRSQNPLVSYLFAARAYNKIGESSTAHTLLKQAEQFSDGSSLAVALTQAELYVDDKKYELALATLKRLRQRAPKNVLAIRLLQQTFIGLNDWAGVIELLPELKKYKVLEKAELESLELMAAQSQLKMAARLKVNPVDALHAVWKKMPGSLTHANELVVSYCQYLIALGDEISAEKIIRNQLKRNWDKSLVDLYGRVKGADVPRQLVEAQAWLKTRNNDAALMLCLGRLSLRNQLWGKARDYFESSVKLQLNSEACAELGRLYAHLGEHEKSSSYFQKGLLLDLNGLPELPMPEKR
jgi:HemY protein